MSSRRIEELEHDGGELPQPPPAVETPLTEEEQAEQRREERLEDKRDARGLVDKDQKWCVEDNPAIWTGDTDDE